MLTVGLSPCARLPSDDSTDTGLDEKKATLTIGDDRYLTPDLEAANQLIASAQILNTLNIPLPELAA